MERAFLSALDNLALNPTQGILLAVSGGVDSMVMATLFVHHAIGPLAVVHMNFTLRGEASDGDAAFVSDWASRQGIPCYTKTVDTRGIAAQRGISIEMAARDLRYDWFEQIRQQLGFGYIAVAHNANDDVETVLLNLVRGTGLRGLCGIPQRNESIIRPLLGVTRQAIESYAHTQQIAFRVDATNAQTDFARNKIRHQVLPVLREMAPALETRMGRNKAHWHQALALLDGLAAQKRAEVFAKTDGAETLSIAALCRDGHASYWLHEFLAPYGFSSRQTEAVAKALHGQSGKCFYAPGYVLVMDREVLRLTKPTEGVSERPFTQYEITERPPHFHFPDNPWVACIDADKVTTPLTIRTWQPGDRMQPLGMNHFKKISDILVDMKVPLDIKAQVQVVCAGADIVWLVGYRLDHRYRVTPATTRLLVCQEREDAF